jgi:hypothetical protein
MTLVIIGCRKKETLGEEAVRRQHAIVWAEMESETGVWSERAGNWSSMGSAVLDIDGDGIKEILLYIGYHWETKWWLWYYKDGKWHEVSDTPFMYAHEWDTYYRTNDVKNLPRFFRQSGGSIEAIIFDKEKGTVTLEPFDGQKFEELQKQGVLL